MALQIVFLYATEDAKHLENIKKSIRIFKDQNLLDYWDETMLMAGDHRAIIEQKISASDIIIPLLSADFLADDTCNKYLDLAVTKGKYLLPIVVRACQWKYHAVLKTTEPAPKQDKEVVPVTDKRWNPIADAYDTIATNVIAVVEKLQTQNLKTKSLTETNTRDMPTENLTFDNGYALLIGVGKYEHANSLPITVSDAKVMQQILSDPNRAGYLQDNTHLLIPQNGQFVTKQKIIAALEDFAKQVNEKQDKNSTVIVYYSGHGDIHNKVHYLCPSDFSIKNEVVYNGISADEFIGYIDQIEADRIVVLLDCCYAGGIKTDANIASQLKQGKGKVIIASSSDKQTSKILRGASYSLFTDILVKALSGECMHNDNGNTVRIMQLLGYVDTELRKAKKEQDVQVNKADGLQSFPICAYNRSYSQKNSISQWLESFWQKEAVSEGGGSGNAPIEPVVNEPVKTNVNMDELKTFQTSLRQIIKDQGFAGTPEVFRLIQESRFAYNPATLVTLRGQAAEMLTQLAPAGFLVSVTSFIDSLRLN